MPTTKLQFIGTGFRFISDHVAEFSKRGLDYPLFVQGEAPREQLLRRTEGLAPAQAAATVPPPPGPPSPDAASSPRQRRQFPAPLPFRRNRP